MTAVDLAYRLVNVFAQSPLAGNPLCVFEDAGALDDATMQALALQFNLLARTRGDCQRRSHGRRTRDRNRARRDRAVAPRLHRFRSQQVVTLPATRKRHPTPSWLRCR